MNHNMRKTGESFKRIKDISKGVEYRLFDETRRKISEGDTITFINRDDKLSVVNAKVTKLKTYPSLLEMHADSFNNDLKKRFKTIEDVIASNVVPYSEKEIARFGLIAISYKKLKRRNWLLILPWLLFFMFFSGTVTLYTAVPSFEVNLAGSIIERPDNRLPIPRPPLPIPVNPMPPGESWNLVTGGGNGGPTIDQEDDFHTPEIPPDGEVVIRDGVVSATIANNVPRIENILPAETVDGTIVMTNNSTVPTYLRIRFNVEQPGFFAPGHSFDDVFKMNFANSGLWFYYNGWYYYRVIVPVSNNVSTTLVQSVSLLGNIGNHYQGRSATITMQVNLIEATPDRVRALWINPQTGGLSETTARLLNFI